MIDRLMTGEGMLGLTAIHLILSLQASFSLTDVARSNSATANWDYLEKSTRFWPKMAHCFFVTALMQQYRLITPGDKASWNQKGAEAMIALTEGIPDSHLPKYYKQCASEMSSNWESALR